MPRRPSSIGLLKARPECFGNSRFILGNPWKHEPYGYCCSDGRRAFLAINNGVWRDTTVELSLGPAWGLPDGKRWDLYRRYPRPAQLQQDEEGFASSAKLPLRAMEIVLLEVVPHGEAPTWIAISTCNRWPSAFAEPSSTLNLREIKPKHVQAVEWKVLKPAEMRSQGGAKLNRLSDHSILAAGDNPSPDTYRLKAATDVKRITAIRIEALPDDGLPNRGPGRAENGNFTLLEFKVAATPRDNSSGKKPVRIRRANASFSQTSFGGWPISAGPARTLRSLGDIG